MNNPNNDILGDIQPLAAHFIFLQQLIQQVVLYSVNLNYFPCLLCCQVTMKHNLPCLYEL